MTRAEILSALTAAEAAAAAWRRLLDELDAGAPESAPPPGDRLLDTSAAARLMNRSTSWLYATARRHPSIGWKLPTGSWVWSERGLIAFRAGQIVACEESDAAVNSANGR